MLGYFCIIDQYARVVMEIDQVQGQVIKCKYYSHPSNSRAASLAQSSILSRFIFGKLPTRIKAIE